MNEANLELNHLRNLLKIHYATIETLRTENEELRMRNIELIDWHTALLNTIHKVKVILASGRTVGNNMMIAYKEAEEALQ